MVKHCTCPPRDPFDPDYQCEYCEHVQEWRAGKAGDPNCPTCDGHGSYADGDALAGVQWTETCECVSPPGQQRKKAVG